VEWEQSDANEKAKRASSARGARACRTRSRGTTRCARGAQSVTNDNRFVDATRSRRAEAGRNADAAAALELAAEPGQEHSVRLAEVRRAFFGLPDEQRAALHLVAIEGLSYQAAADALAIPLGTLMSRIGRARAALRESETEGTTARRARLRLIGGPQ